MSSCGGDADGPGVARSPQVASAPATSCSVTSAGGGWVNQAFLDQTRRFHVEFDATPSNTVLDAVMGSGSGSAQDFTQLAAIVRFNAVGGIDARAGSAYQAVTPLAYQANTTYHIRFDVDPRHQSYSAFVRQPGARYAQLADSYPYRTEQAGLTDLNNLATNVDSDNGTLAICNVSVVTDATTADGCVVAAAGDGPVSVPLNDATMLDTVTFAANPDRTPIDAVIGLSAGELEGFTDLAAAVRLAPSGAVDVRDGDSYRADSTLSYTRGAITYRIVADVRTHLYSVFTNDSSEERARRYRFRTEQSAQTHLDHLGVIVDGDEGSVRVCGIAPALSSRVAYSIEGIDASTVVPMDHDSALISGIRVDANGEGAENAGGPVASPPFERSTADSFGNRYVASAARTAVTVAKTAPDGQSVWATTIPIQPSDNHPTFLESLVVTPAGGAVVVKVLGLFERSYQLGPDGTPASGAGSPPTDGSISQLLDEGTISYSTGSSLVIKRFDRDGQLLWQREFATDARITKLIVDPDDNVIFGGNVSGRPDFGGGPILPPQPIEEDPVDGYLVKLSSAGDHVFSKRLEIHTIGGIASNGERIVVSGTRLVGPSTVHLLSYDATGGPGHAYGSPGWWNFGDDNGDGGAVAMGLTGRVWWTRTMQWPVGARPSAPFLITLEE